MFWEADGASRSRTLDVGDDRGDLRDDAADHEGARRRGGHPPGQPIALRPGRERLLQGTFTHTPRLRSRGASRPARSSSTTPMTQLLRARAADGRMERPAAWLAHGGEGIRTYTRQQACSSRASRPSADVHMFPYNKRVTGLLLRLFKLLYGPASATRTPAVDQPQQVRAARRLREKKEVRAGASWASALVLHAGRWLSIRSRCARGQRRSRRARQGVPGR